MSPADRLNFRMWLDQAARANNQWMKEYVDGTGQEIVSKDANGNNYIFGPVEKKRVTFPLFEQAEDGTFITPILDALRDHQYSNPEDLIPKRKGSLPWFLNLRIGATKLKSYLKAKDRVLLHGAVTDLTKTEDVIELRIQRDAVVDDGTGEEYREYGGDSE